jgi:hypothetical protein
VFGAIVGSPEGGVFEASGDPQQLSDVRIRQGAGYGLNPEMLARVLDAHRHRPASPSIPATVPVRRGQPNPWRLKAVTHFSHAESLQCPDARRIIGPGAAKSGDAQRGS